MAKPISKPSRDTRSSFIVIAGVAIIFYTLWTLINPLPKFSTFLSVHNARDHNCLNVTHAAAVQDPSDETFYDDPETRYTIDGPMKGWDEKRRNWLKHHPAFRPGPEPRVVVLTGSQHLPCNNPGGDHLLLRFFKNKVDYCRIHGCQIFYNNLLLEPKMNSFWAKIPVVRAAMLAHPEADWILWVDADAIFTDMDFTIPFERYGNHNLVVHGWPDMIYEKKSWVSVNAGIFLMRNCQWSMDFLDTWAKMGPKSPDYNKWAQILKETLPDKAYPGSDDQSALVYLILKGKKWRNKICVENTYELHGYWIGIVDKYEEVDVAYQDMDRKEPKLRRRHAEVVSRVYAAERERFLKNGQHRRAFITHFTGCSPCNGYSNPEYKGDSCRVGMERALNFADNQVLRNFGFRHPNLRNGSLIRPLPLDFPGKSIG